MLVPKVRPDRRAGPTSPTQSLRGLKTERQFDREARRQLLLDQRWRRWRSMIITGALVCGSVTGAIPIDNVVESLVKAIGVA